MKTIFLILFYLCLSIPVLSQNSNRAFAINKALNQGINFGNMFEAPTETAWGNPWLPHYPSISFITCSSPQVKMTSSIQRVFIFPFTKSA